MSRIKKKLRSRVGESLAETLVAVLVIAIALTMLAGMISATASMVMTTREKMKVYYKENIKLEKLESTVGEEGKINLSIGEAKGTETINITKITVTAVTNNEFEKTPVIAYKAG